MDTQPIPTGSYKANPQVFQTQVGIDGLVALYPHCIRILQIGPVGLTVTASSDARPIDMDYEGLSSALDRLEKVAPQDMPAFVRGKFTQNECADPHRGALMYTLAFACYNFWQPGKIPAKDQPLVQKNGLNLFWQQKPVEAPRWYVQPASKKHFAVAPSGLYAKHPIGRPASVFVRRTKTLAGSGAGAPARG